MQFPNEAPMIWNECEFLSEFFQYQGEKCRQIKRLFFFFSFIMEQLTLSSLCNWIFGIENAIQITEIHHRNINRLTLCVCATNKYVFPCKWNLKRQRIRRRKSQRNISIFVRFDSVFSELVRCAVFVCWFRHVLCCMPSHSFAITIYLNFKIINQPCKVIYGTFFNRFSGGPFNTMHFYCSLKE